MMIALLHKLQYTMIRICKCIKQEESTRIYYKLICPTCNGAGFTWCNNVNLNLDKRSLEPYYDYMECPDCDGEGYVNL